MSDGTVYFRASVTLKAEGDGGRKTPIQNGFRTDLEFKKEYRIVAIDFSKDLMFPGEKCPAICKVLLHSDSEIEYLLREKTAHLADGPNIIGAVELIDVIERSKVVWDED